MPKDLFEAAANSLSDTSAPQPPEKPGQSARRAPSQPAPRATANVPPPQPATRPTAQQATASPTAPSVKDQFRVRFRRQLVLIVVMLPAVWAAKLNSRESHSPLEIAALAVIFVGFILTLINWRCPSCNRYLYRRIYPRSCPRCGVIFHD
jgi:hypothetical protein